MRHPKVKAAALTDHDGWIDQPLQAGDYVWVHGTHLACGPASSQGVFGKVIEGEDFEGLVTVKVDIPGFSSGSTIHMYAHQVELVPDESLEAAAARFGRFAAGSA
jgi:hypothetical protein